MIAQILLLALLALLAFYAFSQWRLSRPVAAVMLVCAVVGAVLVLRPQISTSVANALGVGRGADLILYLFVVLALVAIFNLHLRLRAGHEMLTRLAREIALQAATHEREDRKGDGRGSG